MLYRDTATAFLERVRADKVCLGAQHSIMSPNVVELYGWAGLDFVVIGTEVEAIDKSMIETLLRAANGAGITPLVKLAHADPRLVTETLNWGAPLVLCPHVTSRAVLDELIAAARFFPIGTRGECPLGRYTQYGLTPLDQSRDATNAARAIVPIIEDREALENIHDIVSHPDIDMIEIGPFDFARSLETKLRGPVVMEAIDTVVAAARSYGKKVMMPMWMTPENDSYPKMIEWQVEKLVSRGITVLFQPDLHVLSDHYRSLAPLRRITVRSDEALTSSSSDPIDVDAMIAAAAAPPPPEGATQSKRSKRATKANGQPAKSTPDALAAKSATAAPVAKAGKARKAPAAKPVSAQVTLPIDDHIDVAAMIAAAAAPPPPVETLAMRDTVPRAKPGKAASKPGASDAKPAAKAKSEKASNGKANGVKTAPAKASPTKADKPASNGTLTGAVAAPTKPSPARTDKSASNGKPDGVKTAPTKASPARADKSASNGKSNGAKATPTKASPARADKSASNGKSNGAKATSKTSTRATPPPKAKPASQRAAARR